MFIDGKFIRSNEEVNGKFSGPYRGGVDLFKSPFGAAARAAGCFREMSAARLGKKFCLLGEGLGEGA